MKKKKKENTFQVVALIMMMMKFSLSLSLSLSICLAHRKHKRLAPVCHVLVCSDCTLLPPLTMAMTAGVEPVFCVELKPKQGFLSRGHQHCPFCLNQFLKVPFSSRSSRV